MLEIKYMYILIQHKHSKNISLQWDARNQIHVQTDPAQAWKNVSIQLDAKIKSTVHILADPAQAQQEHQSPIRCKNQIHVHTDPAQAQQERQSPMECEEIKSTYMLVQHKHSKNISLQSDAKYQIHVLADPQ